MSPRSMMILGSLTGGLASAFFIINDASGAAAVMAFCGGALFGKGYGIWEQKQ